jgi:hypothetical protein
LANFYYHATYTIYLESILREGLRPPDKEWGAVWISDDPEIAAGFVVDNGRTDEEMESGTVVLRIDAAQLDSSKLHQAEKFDYSDDEYEDISYTYSYVGTIPPEALSVWDGVNPKTASESDCDLCGSTGVLEDEKSETGYVHCPACEVKYPHNVQEDDTCVYCGMYYPDGPCPALVHPQRDLDFMKDVGITPFTASTYVTIPLLAFERKSTKIAISLPELVQQTNAFSKKNRPGCTPQLLNSNPPELFLNYNVKCKLKTSDPAGHDVRVKFDVSKVEESQMAKDLDLQVACSCPAFLYWGAQWNLHQRDGLYGQPRPELIAPTERLDLRGNYVICKHVHAVFERILPSVQHNIVKILRERSLKDKEEAPDKLKHKQDEMRKKKDKKYKEVQDKLMDALRKREEEQLIKEQEPVVERDETATPVVVETPKAPGKPDVSIMHQPEDITDLLEKEDKRLKEEKHRELKNKPHLHSGLPYETDVEKQEHGHNLPSDRDLLKKLKEKEKEPNKMKDFLDKKLKKRTSLETSLLAALEVDDDEFTSGDD